ncbi:hypothetical protein BJQ94_06125 [Cryobacterium sp. SO2]|uniref:hypothetical protein n=1 Tax=Cryobacterium sp. SO2 TaxID=1897060 RepID=UPI00223C9105|nr:hypothetical protein [Cryobacterium sp. SO2]WEO78608.1 hypothetical protein BJQ94_06125 [Cryobacterium sp. SO2]
MRGVYRIVCHIIAACVVIQAAVIAWATFSVIVTAEQGSTVSEDAGIVGFITHSIVGQYVIPLLALALLVIALVGRIGIRWAAWLLVAVLVQVMLGYISFGLPGLGLLHGVNAFVVLALAEMGAASVRATSTQTPVAERSSAANTAADDSV